MKEFATILIDNNPHPTEEFATEHGLSILLHLNKGSFLYDVGASTKFIDNAIKLKINLKEIEGLILSHGHKDHTGGLEAFIPYLYYNKVYAATTIDQYNYFSLRHSSPRNISINHELLPSLKERYKPISQSQWITPEIALIYNTIHNYPSPKANNLLEKEEITTHQITKDDFNHEISIAYKNKDQLSIFSACSHQGVLNIITSCCNFTNCYKVKNFIGGMHLLNDHEAEEEIALLMQTLLKLHPTIKIHTGHCTGDKVLDFLTSHFPDNINAFYSGKKIQL